MQKKRRLHFSLAAIMFGMFVLAVFLAETQASFRWMSVVITIVTLEVLAFGVCAEVLTRNIPSSLARKQRRNCRRTDGTWSEKRERIEERSLAKLRRELLKAFLLIALASNVGLAYVHFGVIPLTIAIDAMSSFDLSESKWKSNLRDEEAKMDSWMGHSMSAKKLTSRKRMLWNSWPLVVGIGILWVLGSFAFVARAYAEGLNELAASLKYRSEQYRLRELHSTVGHDDFAKVSRRRRKKSRRRSSRSGRDKSDRSPATTSDRS